MNMGGYAPVKEEGVTHQFEKDRLKSSNMLPTLMEEEYNTTTGATSSSSTPVQNEAGSSSQEDSLNPALLLNRYDKRKSSPAILGLPFGLNHEAQLSLHLSQQRNSIEAAMLLANFNKLMAFPKANEVEHKVPPPQWQDDMSIPSQNKNSWGDVLSNESDGNRRHSYDVNMSWQTMSEEFLERPDLLHNMGNNQINPHFNPEQVPVFKQENFYSHTPTKVSWSHDDLHNHHHHHPHPHPHQQQPPTQPTLPPQQQIHHPTQPIQPQHPYGDYPISPRQQHNSRLYHPNMSSPLAPHTYHPRYSPAQPQPPLSSSQQQQSHPPPPQPQSTQPTQQEHHPGVMLHPLARQPDMKTNDPQQQQHQYYSYTFPPQHPMQQRYYYPNGKLPLPTGPMDAPVHHPPPILAKPKRKKQKSNNTDEFDEELGGETNEEDYPEMSTRDVEAARSDPEARPRKQKLRFTGDKYTPQWVRYNGQSKEGLCDTCKPGKWLQLKNSAYWYHKQFFHGISSVSGKEFVQPLETRWVDQDLVEGLCHQCHQWVAVSNVKRKNSVLWYRHAHKCHVYHKPKPNVPKKR
ncbi:hypothetical protein INT47_008197 [Mucor saturninus]|uniref:Transcription regulator Rua1 C-terminal domain-containing protein n=1 Tax=Mucor saturninus TaxID=64648 RepID=A0A8H7R416_9FUNG|nr:hypothetical protein INT47_008197 [Mucor saturninus]